MFSTLMVFIASLAVILFAGHFIVTCLGRAARAFGISEFSLAFVLLALATSLPEISVGLASARQEAGGLILGVAFGSNIINSTVAIGLATFLSIGLPTATLNIKRDALIGSGIIFLPVLLLLNGTISRPEAVLLLLAFAIYLRLLSHRGSRRTFPFHFPHLSRGFGYSLLSLVFVLIMLLAAKYTVSSATDIARLLKIPEIIIGVIIIAGGTSLPEIVTAVQAARKGRDGIALGNIFGSNIANSTLIIGLPALISPLHATFNAPLLSTIIFMGLAIGLLAYFSATRQRLNPKEGLLLIGLYLVFIFASLLTGLLA